MRRYIQTKLDWDFESRPRINPERLKEKILKSFFDAGFVMDFGNGVVAESYEEYIDICNILQDTTNQKV